MTRAAGNRPLLVLLAAVCLDVVGVGLIFPILPRLLADVPTSGTSPRTSAP